VSLVQPILDHCTLGWWRGPFLLDDACGAPGLLGPGRIALGHIPFYRAVECCDRYCPYPSDCPPRTRDRFAQAIRLDSPPVSPAPNSRPSTECPRRVNTLEEATSSVAPRACRAASSAAKLGEVLPVRREQVTSVTRAVTRFVTPGMPGRIIDLMV